MTRRRLSSCALVAILSVGALQAAGGRDSIATADLKEWLTYIASDELSGRAVFTEGLGLAAGYIQDRLRSWNIKPAGDHGTYLQTVRVVGVQSANRSRLTIRIGSETRTFKHGEGISFPVNVGGKRTLTVTRVEFAGYGLEVPAIKHSDFAGSSLDGAAVVYLGTNGPKALNPRDNRRILGGRSRYAIDQLKALAAIGPATGLAARGTTASDNPTPGPSAPASPAASRAPDFTTAQRLDLPVAPSVTANDELFQFLFSKAPVKYDELRRRATEQEPLPRFRLEGVGLTFEIEADYTIVRTQLTQNVVAVVEGSDPQLKSTYVAVGAHYDHVGYADAELASDGRRPTPPGRVTAGAADDRIWNGADDDGSGTVALMSLARAFAQGARPKRSLLLIWHAGEERGLYGSRYFADHPTVPIDRIVAQLNIDMIGRNRNDLKSESNTVYVVGSDRISSELHQVNRAANATLRPPLRLDYEMNDPSDPEQLYYRSDHYSYAAKGIPIIFFTTGLHPDYHANTDEVSKIEFDKLTRIAQLIYETSWRLANLEHPPVRDNKGPRAGKGTSE